METQSFSPFPRLPAELRIKILLFAIAEPSIITLHSTRLGYPGTNDDSWGECRHENHVFITDRPVPSLFQVSAESREVCLSHYTLGFAVSITKSRSPAIWPYSVNGHHDHVLSTQPTRARCCHEELVSSGRLKHIYWNPHADVLHMKRLPGTDHGVSDADYDLSKIAYLWADYSWSRYNIVLNGVHRVALSLVMFGRWYKNPRQGLLRGIEVVYVLLKRRVGEDDQEWDEHVKWFGRWFAPRMKSFLQDEKVKIDPLPFDTCQLKLVGLMDGEELDMKDLVNAENWLADTTGTWSPEDQEFQKQRYPEIFR
ncbi:hypothetical protein DL98DRAFT_41012 [Cadophora sp. DSE1049]|nr:hypothetical protein DL98DRAFT_41012 [Cadophora sp. DSE1049]